MSLQIDLQTQIMIEIPPTVTPPLNPPNPRSPSPHPPYPCAQVKGVADSVGADSVHKLQKVRSPRPVSLPPHTSKVCGGGGGGANLCQKLPWPHPASSADAQAPTQVEGAAVVLAKCLSTNTLTVWPQMRQKYGCPVLRHKMSQGKAQIPVTQFSSERCQQSMTQ